MRILFIGCVKSSFILLNELLEYGMNVCGVITKKKNTYNSDFEDLTPLCRKHGIQVEFSEDSNETKIVGFIKDMKPDVIYCFGWSNLLSNEIIRSSRLGVVGFHPAKLPYNRGRHPIIWALVLGLTETASTFFMIDETADTGAIISQDDIEIELRDDADSLYQKIMLSARRQVIDFTNQFINNSVGFKIQDPSIGNTWRKRTKKDGSIDFRMTALNIYNLVRGLTKPYIGAHFEHKAREYKVWKCQVVRDKENTFRNIEFGKILEVYSSKSFLIKTGDELLKILDCDEIDLEIGDYL